MSKAKEKRYVRFSVNCSYELGVNVPIDATDAEVREAAWEALRKEKVDIGELSYDEWTIDRICEW